MTRDVLLDLTIASPLRDRPSFRLVLWDTGRRDGRGQTRLGYELSQPGGWKTLFSGEDFAGSPMHADDSLETVQALLTFLTLRPGDTDREYFEGYAPHQLEWAGSSECEAMQAYALDDDEAREWFRSAILSGWDPEEDDRCPRGRFYTGAGACPACESGEEV